MALIDQTIPESQKNEEWIKRVSQNLITQISSVNWEKQKDITCRNLVKGNFNESDFDYLTKVGNYTFPAKIRFVPIIKNSAQNLISDYALRPFKFAAYAFDALSIDKKVENQSRFFLNNIHKLIWDHAGNYRTGAKMVQDILAQSAQAQQAATATAEGQAQQVEAGVQGQQAGPEHMILPPEVENQLQQINDVMNKNFELSQQEIAKIDALYKMSPRELYEVMAQKGLEYLIFSQKLERQFMLGFNSKIVTNKPIYFVDYDETMLDPQLKKIDEVNFFYAADTDMDMIQDAEWATLQSYPTVASLLDQFRYELSDEDLKKLYQRNLNGYGTQYYGQATYNGSCYVSINGVQVPILETTATCRLSKVYFKSPRKVIVEKKPVGEDATHTRFYEDDELSDKKIAGKKEKGVQYRNKFITDVYENIMIDQDICVRARKKPYQFRSKDDYSVDLPFIGEAWQSNNRLTTSSVWDAKDIQFLYNIVFYFQELAISLSGTKGTVMDKSQIPDGMSMAEWEYKKKMGTMYIDTNKKGRTASFNQFQNYNESIDGSIQYYQGMLTYLERLCGSIMGVPPERVGMIDPNSAVGNNQQVVRQSSLTTEIKFKEHDFIKQSALERLVNCFPVSWKNGKRAAYMFNGLQEILDIPAQLMNDARYRLSVEDGSKNKMAIDLAHSIIGSKTAAGQIPLSTAVKLINVESLTMLEKQLQQLEEQQQKIEQQNIQLQAQSKGEADQQTLQVQAQLEMQKLEMEGKIKETLAKVDNEFKQMELGLKQQELAFKEQELQVETAIREKELSIQQNKVMLDYQAKMADAESERITEMAYLEEEARQFDIVDGTNNKSLQIDAFVAKQKAEESKAKADATKNKAITDRQVKIQKAKDETGIREKKTAQEMNHKNAKVLQDIAFKRKTHETNEQFAKRKQNHEMLLKQEAAENESDNQQTKHEEAMEQMKQKHEESLRQAEEKHQQDMKLKKKALNMKPKEKVK